MDKPKFNLTDGLIIVAVVLVIAVGVFFISNMGGQTNVGGGENTNAVFDIQLTRVEKALADKFVAAKEGGETVWIGVKERFEGKIQDVRVESAARQTVDLYSGKATIAKDPTCCDVTVTVKSAAVETASSISASGTAIRVGEEVAIRGKGVAGYGFVIGLKTVSEQEVEDND